MPPPPRTPEVGSEQTHRSFGRRRTPATSSTKSGQDRPAGPPAAALASALRRGSGGEVGVPGSSAALARRTAPQARGGAEERLPGAALRPGNPPGAAGAAATGCPAGSRALESEPGAGAAVSLGGSHAGRTFTTRAIFPHVRGLLET